MQKPNFWRLFVAYGIDIFILTLVNIVWAFGGISLLSSVASKILVLLFAVSFVFLNGGYFAALEQKQRGSLGKKIVNLKVMSKKANVLTFWRVFFAYVIDSALFLFFAFVSFIFGAAISAGIVLRHPSMQYQDGSGYIVIILLTIVFGVPFLYLIYYVFSEALFGASIGKASMGLQVVQETK